MVAGALGRLPVQGLIWLLPLLAWGSGPADAGVALCTPRVAEKLGVRFVEVCGAEQQEPFWISAAPMPCSAGEHETIDCPSVTPLLTGDSAVPLTSRRVAVIGSFTAHRLCGLRFAGRVATRHELERARAVLGLTAVVVAEPPAPASEFHFEALPEWTADGECDNPSNPGKRCRFVRWPHGAVRHAPMADIRACDAEPVGPVDQARTRVEIGGSCAAHGWTWKDAATGDSHELPCHVSLAVAPIGGAGATPFALSCRAPDAQPPRAPAADGSNIAAFRCVVPAGALATFGEPQPTP